MNNAICESRPVVTHQQHSARRPQHRVNFFCDAPQAECVSVIGDFNGWDSTATPMRRMPDGRWLAGMDLRHGHHRYLFVVDGRPQLDPKAHGVTRNERNEPVSLIAVS